MRKHKNFILFNFIWTKNVFYDYFYGYTNNGIIIFMFLGCAQKKKVSENYLCFLC